MDLLWHSERKANDYVAYNYFLIAILSVVTFNGVDYKASILDNPRKMCILTVMSDLTLPVSLAAELVSRPIKALHRLMQRGVLTFFIGRRGRYEVRLSQLEALAGRPITDDAIDAGLRRWCGLPPRAPGKET